MKVKTTYFISIIIIFFLFLPKQGISQLRLTYGAQFDSIYKSAENYWMEKEYTKSANAYENAFSLKEEFPVILFYQEAFRAYFFADNIDKAFFYLDHFTKKGIVSHSNFEHLDKHERFIKLRKDPRWENIRKRIIKKHKKYGNVVKKLNDINLKDQTLRKLLKCAENEFKDDDKKMNYLWKLINNQDSLNLINLEYIIKKHGWLGKYKVGEEASSVFWKVIQHSTLEVQEKYLPLIKSSVIKGETSSAELAFLEDRINLYKGLPQIYGTQICNISPTENKVYPILNPEKVEERRRKIGFEPLEEYLSFFDIKINSLRDLQQMELLNKW